jgi:hypothetical protein
MGSAWRRHPGVPLIATLIRALPLASNGPDGGLIRITITTTDPNVSSENLPPDMFRRQAVPHEPA